MAKIIIAGSSFTGSTTDIALARYNADGSLDTAFGAGDGIVTTAIGGATDIAYNVAVPSPSSAPNLHFSQPR